LAADMNAKELAQALGVRRAEVYRMKRDGCPVDESGRWPRYDLTAVRTWMRKTAVLNGAPDVRHAELDVRTQEVEVHARDLPHYWPDGRPLPRVYIRQRIPCTQCRRLHLDDLSQAVVVKSQSPDGGIAYFRCRGCGHRFKLAVDRRP
jgi:hypothetical protein